MSSHAAWMALRKLEYGHSLGSAVSGSMRRASLAGDPASVLLIQLAVNGPRGARSIPVIGEVPRATCIRLVRKLGRTPKGAKRPAGSSGRNGPTGEAWFTGNCR